MRCREVQRPGCCFPVSFQLRIRQNKYVAFRGQAALAALPLTYCLRERGVQRSTAGWLSLFAHGASFLDPGVVLQTKGVRPRHAGEANEEARLQCLRAIFWRGTSLRRATVGRRQEAVSLMPGREGRRQNGRSTCEQPSGGCAVSDEAPAGSGPCCKAVGPKKPVTSLPQRLPPTPPRSIARCEAAAGRLCTAVGCRGPPPLGHERAGSPVAGCRLRQRLQTPDSTFQSPDSKLPDSSLQTAHCTLLQTPDSRLQTLDSQAPTGVWSLECWSLESRVWSLESAPLVLIANLAIRKQSPSSRNAGRCVAPLF